jgi:hypothetical protein
MSSFQNILINANLSDTIWFGVKIVYLIVLGLYVIFAIILNRQIVLMIQTLDGTLNLPIKILGWVFLLLTIFVFFLGLLIL